MKRRSKKHNRMKAEKYCPIRKKNIGIVDLDFYFVCRDSLPTEDCCEVYSCAYHNAMLMAVYAAARSGRISEKPSKDDFHVTAMRHFGAIDYTADSCRFDNTSESSDRKARHTCDVCSQKTLYEPEGYCLTTRQVVTCPEYWERTLAVAVSVFQRTGDVSDGDLVMAILPMLQQFADSPTPWIVCDDCIDIFPVDKVQTHEYAVEWWKSGKKYAPPGNGPVRISEIRLPTDKYPWAAAVNVVIKNALRLGTFRRPSSS